MLFEDRGEIGLGDIVREGVVPEDDGGFTSGSELFVPVGYSERQRLDLGAGDGLVEAGDQGACTYGVHELSGDGQGFHGYAEIETELQQQLVEDVLFASISLDVVNVVEQCCFDVVGCRLPFADVGCVELEHAKAEVSDECEVLLLDFLQRRGAGVP